MDYSSLSAYKYIRVKNTKPTTCLFASIEYVTPRYMFFEYHLYETLNIVLISYVLS